MTQDAGPQVERLRSELERQARELETAHAALERERWRFAQFVLAAPDAYLVTDADGRVIVANPAAAHLLQVTLGRLTGADLLDLVASSDRASLERQLRELTARGGNLQFAVRPRGHRSVVVSAVVAVDEMPEGRELWWQLHDASRETSSRQPPSSHLVRGLAPGADGDSDEWKDAFLLAAAHDLRAPFAIIRMLAQTLLGRTTLGLQSTLVEQVDEQATRGLRLLNGLLDLSRFTTGGVLLKRVPTDLLALVESVCQDLEWNSHPLDIDVEPLTAEVDPERTSQILANLLGNAFEHTPSGTSIRVRIDLTDSVLRLIVEDEGPGVPDDLKPDVFAPFVTRRAHASDHGGTGVGLALVQLFAELHDGRAAVEDRPGGGARFVVELGLPDGAAVPGDGEA